MTEKLSPESDFLPIDDQHWPKELEPLRGGFATRLNIYRVMAHHPALLSAWESLRNHLVLNSRLTPQQREMIILRTGHRWNSAYEWAHHVVRGREAGLTADQIAAAADEQEGSALSDELSCLLRGVDELIDEGRLTALTLAHLQQSLGLMGVMDFMAIVGFYTSLAFLANSLAVPIEPNIAAEVSHTTRPCHSASAADQVL